MKRVIEEDDPEDNGRSKKKIRHNESKKTINYTLCIIGSAVVINTQRVMNERVIILWIAVKR